MQDWSYDGFRYRRRPTRVVHVGDVGVGGDQPIRVQSMTTPATSDTEATVRQIERLVEAGCEIVRVTVPTSRDADSLPALREAMAQRGLRVPLVADIHFTPAAAMKAVEHVEKVRINPGNFADKKKFAVREYSDAEYEQELERIADKFGPLVDRARERGVSMRIGTNHGSLSDRIMNRYGDTPEGMVESALEFVRICESRDYRELILSMKASNPLVVQQAYRLLVERMHREQMDYPLHLGVTEAGDGEDGRIKSAMGIGALLAEGIGDTVRVSLTEDPVAEIPVARQLVEPYNRPAPREAEAVEITTREHRDPYTYARRASAEVPCGPQTLGGTGTVRVEVPLGLPLDQTDELRRTIDAQAGVRVGEDVRAEIVSVNAANVEDVARAAELAGSLRLVAPRLALSCRIDAAVLDGDPGMLEPAVTALDRLHVRLGSEDAADPSALRRAAAWLADRGGSLLLETGSELAITEAVEQALGVARELADVPLALALGPSRRYAPLNGYRLLAARLADERLDPPLVLLDDPASRGADPLLGAATMLGGVLCDGIGDSIHVVAADPGESRRLAFGILQAARVRITRTEFISCPSCGRTLFDLEETTARIKSRTSHLKGVKIAVMGCIVNGPGEMADADFGYVGWGEDKIALFVGKDMVAKDIPTDTADERLVELIKEHGRWVDPPVPSGAH